MQGTTENVLMESDPMIKVFPEPGPSHLVRQSSKLDPRVLLGKTMGELDQRGRRSQILRGQEGKHRGKGLMRGSRVRFVFLKDHSELTDKTCWEVEGQGAGVTAVEQ